MHSRGAGGAPLSQSPLASVSPPTPTLIRTDLHVPVFVFQTEFDISGAFTARQPDTNLFRQWEAAGTSHFDTYGLLIGPSDTGDGQGAVANLEAMQNPTNIPAPGGLCAKPINTGGAHWLLELGDLLAEPVGHERHAASERAAPADRVNVAVCLRQGRQRQHASVACARPQVDAPIATLAGIGNTGANATGSSRVLWPVRLDGALHPAQLAALYKNHGQFVSAWSTATQKLVKEGFLLKADGEELKRSAAQSQIGK